MSIAHEPAFLNEDVVDNVRNQLKILQPPKEIDVPAAVTRLTGAIEKSFGRTSEGLRHRADQLRTMAERLDAQAKDLDSAAPKISDTVHDWIAYETKGLNMIEALRFVEDVQADM